MPARGLDLSDLATRADLSRQGLYRLLRPEYRPFSRGFQSVADALGVSALSLVQETNPPDASWDRITALLEESARGEARAFEVLPSQLMGAPRRLAPPPKSFTLLHNQLLAAAGEIATSLARRSGLKKWVLRHASHTEPGRSFFFAADLMSPERIVATTPEPMQRHLVFGSFDMKDFERHCGR